MGGPSVARPMCPWRSFRQGRQMADLFHQRRLGYRLPLFPLGWRAENRTGTAFQMLLPFGDLRWVDVVLTCQLGSVLSPLIALIATFNLNSDV